MTLYQFKLLSAEVQLHHVLEQGIFLAQRAAPHGAVNLYHLPDGGRGFFAEVTCEQHDLELFVLRSFSSSVPLEDYTHGVRLPQGWA